MDGYFSCYFCNFCFVFVCMFVHVSQCYVCSCISVLTKLIARYNVMSVMFLHHLLVIRLTNHVSFNSLSELLSRRSVSFQQQWFDRWPGLHCDKDQDLVSAFHALLLRTISPSFSQLIACFISTGFSCAILSSSQVI